MIERMLGPVDVQRLLPMGECIEALDRALAESTTTPVQSFVGGVKAPEGKFHLKAALSGGEHPMFAAKLNANFPGNPSRGLPTIQGALMLFDATNGTLLATMDSAAVTAIRTAAATAVAARHLASPGACTLAIVGCGAQALHHVEAINLVRPLKRVKLYDVNAAVAQELSTEVERRVGVPVQVCGDLMACTAGADMVVTLTSARSPFLTTGHVQPGTFVAGVGTDSPDKSELDPALMAQALVVVDDAAQCAEMGDLHHAVAAGLVQPASVWGTLAEVCAAPARFTVPPGRTVVFDSTGIPIEDVVATRLIYERSRYSDGGGKADPPPLSSGRT